MKAKVRAAIEFDMHLLSTHEGASTFVAKRIEAAIEKEFTASKVQKITVSLEKDKNKDCENPPIG
jgi:hypothetical protein